LFAGYNKGKKKTEAVAYPYKKFLSQNPLFNLRKLLNGVFGQANRWLFEKTTCNNHAQPDYSSLKEAYFYVQLNTMITNHPGLRII
jgi:hypothetical protein